MAASRDFGNIDIRPDEAMKRVLPFAAVQTFPNISIPRQTTVAEVATLAFPYISQCKRPVLLPFKHRIAPESLRIFRDLALETNNSTPKNPTLALPIVTSSDPSKLRIPGPFNADTLRRLQHKALQDEKELKENQTDRYILSALVPVIERVLASMPVTFNLSCMGGGTEITIGPINAIYDMGCQRTVICDQLLDREFLEIMDNDSFCKEKPNGSRLLCGRCCIQFSNGEIELDVIADVRSSDRLPNGFNGVLLGHLGIMDCLDVSRMASRKLLMAKGEQIEDDKWGLIEIDGYLDQAEGKYKEVQKS